MIMNFSLIIATLNTKEKLSRLLGSLANQSYKNFEVLIIDQNPADYLIDIISRWDSELNIIHKNVPFKGLSKARNYGIKIAKSNILAFPDDDCYYESNTLKNVFDHFNNNKETEILICQTKENKKSISNYMKHKNHFYKLNSIYDLFMSKANSISIFLKSNILSRTTREVFDINMGLGSGTIYGSSEETDLLLRLLKKSTNIIVHKNIFVYHSITYPSPSKSYFYGLGRYRLIKKNKIGLIYYLLNLVYPIINIFIRFDFKKYKSYIATIVGRAGCEFLYPIYLNSKD